MKKVIIYRLNQEAQQDILVECNLTDEGVKFDGDQQMAEMLLKNGITDYDTKTIIFPKDGLRFLEQMKYNFHSGYLNATDIIEDEHSR